MKVFVTILLVASGAAIGAYSGAHEHNSERAFFMFSGVVLGFSYRHFFYK